MPRLRRLDGKTLVMIFEQLGFEVIDISGSHHKLRRILGDQKQTLTIPVHGKETLHPRLIRKIFRDAQIYIAEDELKAHFYSD
jgi:predicted RNA binding protein YcfA (HicA-like mRNA interferase family)